DKALKATAKIMMGTSPIKMAFLIVLLAKTPPNVLPRTIFSKQVHYLTLISGKVGMDSQSQRISD
ncbi:hypothetical protein, partial [Vibrio sp. 1579]